MRFQGAIIQEQGVRFAIVIVKPHVVQMQSQGNQAVSRYSGMLGVPVVLMAQDARDVPTYYGRRDIVDFLANVPIEAIPWQEFTLS